MPSSSTSPRWRIRSWNVTDRDVLRVPRPIVAGTFGTRSRRSEPFGWPESSWNLLRRKVGSLDEWIPRSPLSSPKKALLASILRDPRRLRQDVDPWELIKIMKYPSSSNPATCSLKLQEVFDELGIGRREASQRLEVPRMTLNRYLNSDRIVPFSVMRKAVVLLASASSPSADLWTDANILAWIHSDEPRFLARNSERAKKSRKKAAPSSPAPVSQPKDEANEEDPLLPELIRAVTPVLNEFLLRVRSESESNLMERVRQFLQIASPNS